MLAEVVCHLGLIRAFLRGNYFYNPKSLVRGYSWWEVRADTQPLATNECVSFFGI